MNPLKLSTAGQIVAIGPFVDSADPDAVETALTIANTDIKIWKFGASSLVNKNSGGATHMSNGVYYITLDATDTNVLGPLEIHVKLSGVRPYKGEFVVQSANVFDSLVKDADKLSVNATNISVGTAAISTVSTGVVITTGTPTGSYTDTQQADQVYHQVADVAGTWDFYYEFFVGGDGIPVSVTHLGAVTGSNDFTGIYGYNWTTSQWEQIGSFIGVNLLAISERSFSLYSSHVGIGENVGKVRVRFQATGLTSAVIYTDQIYVSYTSLGRSVGYEGGSIWIDTVNGVDGVEPYVNGTADRPTNSYSNALILQGILGLSKFTILQGSSITFTESTENFNFLGTGWHLDANGQIVSNCSIEGCRITGEIIGNSGTLCLENCKLNSVTLPDNSTIERCAFLNTVNFSERGFYLLNNCVSAVAGSASPIFYFPGAGTGNIQMNVRNYSGGFDLRGMVEGDTMSYEGNGQLKIGADCTGESISVRGNFNLTDSSNGAVTLNQDARFSTQQISNAVWDESITEVNHNIAISAGQKLREISSSVIKVGTAVSSTINSITLDSSASSSDGAYDPAQISIIEGTGIGQVRGIFQYDGSTKKAWLDRDWKILPDVTSKYSITAWPGREHVNEGVARGGGDNYIFLNLLASDFDDTYLSQTVFIRSGTGLIKLNILLPMMELLKKQLWILIGQLFLISLLLMLLFLLI